MANVPRPTRSKREKERARQERHKQKVERRAEAKARRAAAPSRAGGEDPDIAGIVPGPQPRPWDDADLPPAEEES